MITGRRNGAVGHQVGRLAGDGVARRYRWTRYRERNRLPELDGQGGRVDRWQWGLRVGGGRAGREVEGGHPRRDGGIGRGVSRAEGEAGAGGAVGDIGCQWGSAGDGVGVGPCKGGVGFGGRRSGLGDDVPPSTEKARPKRSDDTARRFVRLQLRHSPLLERKQESRERRIVCLALGWDGRRGDKSLIERECPRCRIDPRRIRSRLFGLKLPIFRRRRLGGSDLDG